MSRQDAIDRALAFFDEGGFEQRLATLVAIRSTSQDPEFAAELPRYLQEGGAGRCWSGWGSARRSIPTPVEGAGPILIAERMEGADLPTVLTYGHGDTVRGLEDQWRAGLDPWTLTREGDRWYGRGSADNKGQHAINLSALEAVIAARGGRLGFNVKAIIETGEEAGSKGLNATVEAHKAALAADVLLASDGPRSAATDADAVGWARGARLHFDLRLDVRPGGRAFGQLGRDDDGPGHRAEPRDRVHRGPEREAFWCGTGCRRQDQQLGAGGCWQGAGAGKPGGGGDDRSRTGGEPGLTAAEKVYAWTSFIVLSLMSAGGRSAR